MLSQTTSQPARQGYPSIDKPWLKYYREEVINASLPECSIYDYMKGNNQDYPDDIAIIYLGRKISYGQMIEMTERVAASLSAAGVSPGDIVTVATPSIPEAIYTIYALNYIGAVANMIHPLAGEAEIVNYLNEVNSRVAVLFDGTYNIVKNSLDRTSVETVIVVSAGESLPFAIKKLFYLKNPPLKFPEQSICQSWNDFLEKGKGIVAQHFKRDCHALALISHTGGTTGDPKGVMCSDYSINALIYQLVCNFEYTRQLVCVTTLPPFINYSLIDTMLAMFYIGFKVVLIPKYEPEKLCNYIEKYKPYHLSSIPAYWEALLKIDKNKKYDFSSLRYVYYGGEAMNPENEIAITKILLDGGAKGSLCKGLGSTEMMAAATQTYADCNENGSAGVPLVFVNCKLVDPDTNEEVPFNQQGEICFSGPTLMLGYYNKPEATDEIIREDADGIKWLHTGDLGYMNEKGVLYVTGRIKRILMTKGRDLQITKIFPDRVEKVLDEHPAVELSCVIGIPDPERINYPKAFVVLKKGYDESEQLSQEILSFCKDRLPEYMVPEKLEYRLEFPRTARGKVDYRALEKQSKTVSPSKPEAEAYKLNVIDKTLVAIAKWKLNHMLKLNEAKEISTDGIREHLDIPYLNRNGKELRMDIFEPVTNNSQDLPVIINVHGGGLIRGEKSISIGFCRQLAHRGYLVCSLEYRLIPSVRVYEQFDDVCAGMDCIGRKLLDFNVDFTRIYMVAESAGAYLATYVAAMTHSKALQEAIGYKPTRLQFKALGLISGMFYTTRKDAIGRVLARSFYGDDEKSKAMARYTNPEDPEIIYNIPPCYLVTSKADQLERYTMDFAGELGNKGIEHKLRHMGSDPKLLHAFPVLRPDLQESERVIDEIVQWFKEHE